jgi:hypothetical protein
MDLAEHLQSAFLTKFGKMQFFLTRQSCRPLINDDSREICAGSDIGLILANALRGEWFVKGTNRASPSP